MTAPRRLLFISAMLAGIAATLPAAAETLVPRAVAELFTSQGCSSCPPADRVWNELAARGDVLALSLPVDYWDYLGWKDTLAKPAHTARQRGYARALHARSIYTPQGVINGATDVVASRRDAVLSAIDGSARLDSAVSIDIGAADGMLTVSAAPVSERQRRATVWLVVFRPQETVAIGRGENAGRTVVYANVVRDMRRLGIWKGERATYRVSLNELAGDKLHCAVIVQEDADGGPGPIRAAAVLREPL